jgi:hypothetical protein
MSRHLDRRPNAVNQLLAQIRGGLPLNVVEVIRIEMELVEVVLPTTVDHFATERTGVTGLVVDSLPVAREIGDHKLRLTDLAQQAVANVLVVMKFFHPNRGQPAVVLDRGLDSQEVGFI